MFLKHLDLVRVFHWLLLTSFKHVLIEFLNLLLPLLQLNFLLLTKFVKFLQLLLYLLTLLIFASQLKPQFFYLVVRTFDLFKIILLFARLIFFKLFYFLLQLLVGLMYHKRLFHFLTHRLVLRWVHFQTRFLLGKLLSQLCIFRLELCNLIEHAFSIEGRKSSN